MNISPIGTALNGEISQVQSELATFEQGDPGIMTSQTGNSPQDIVELGEASLAQGAMSPTSLGSEFLGIDSTAPILDNLLEGVEGELQQEVNQYNNLPAPQSDSSFLGGDHRSLRWPPKLPLKTHSQACAIPAGSHAG